MKFFSKSTLAVVAAALGFGGAAQAAIIEQSTDITVDTRFSRDNVYVITKVIYILPPAKLTVEPGTIIRAARADITGFTNSPGSIIVTRGCQPVSPSLRMLV